MNVVFFSFALVTAAAVAWTWRRRRAQERLRTREGPVPGYSITPGSALALPDELPLQRGSGFEPLSVETFNSVNRSRIALRLDVAHDQPADTLAQLAAACAKSVADRSAADVVYVELHVGGRLAQYLWTPDGRGWSGREETHEAFFDPGVPHEAH